MVTKSKATKTESKKSRVKVGKLQLNKETVKDLGGKEAKEISGGFRNPTILQCTLTKIQGGCSPPTGDCEEHP